MHLFDTVAQYGTLLHHFQRQCIWFCIALVIIEIIKNTCGCFTVENWPIIEHEMLASINELLLQAWRTNEPNRNATFFTFHSVNALLNHFLRFVSCVFFVLYLLILRLILFESFIAFKTRFVSFRYKWCIQLMLMQVKYGFNWSCRRRNGCSFVWIHISFLSTVFLSLVLNLYCGWPFNQITELHFKNGLLSKS